MYRKFILTVVMILGCVMFAGAQENNIDLQKAQMKKLDGMVGQWNGSGWMQQGPNRTTFTGTENVQRRLGGLALLVEGKFANPDGRVVHETLAVLSYDSKALKYGFQTYLATGAIGAYDFRLVENGYEWGFQTPAGTIRYSISTKNEVWFEIGEFSRDGKNWIKFFEMKLERAK